MFYVIALSNEKGGVGKTTLTTHLGAGLAILGYRVVLIDADPQGNLTEGIGLQAEPGFFELLARNRKWNDLLKVIQPEHYEMPNKPSKGLLAVLPGDSDTQFIQNKIQDPYLILKRFQQLQDTVDFVIVDTSPTPSLLNGSIYLATDGVIYPTLCETFSITGLLKTMNNVQGAPNKEIDVLGIIPNMYRSRTVEHSDNLKDLKTEFGESVWEPIEQSIAWSESTTFRRPLFALDPTIKPAKQAWDMVLKAEKVLNDAVKA